NGARAWRRCHSGDRRACTGRHERARGRRPMADWADLEIDGLQVRIGRPSLCKPEPLLRAEMLGRAVAEATRTALHTRPERLRASVCSTKRLDVGASAMRVAGCYPLRGLSAAATGQRQRCGAAAADGRVVHGLAFLAEVEQSILRTL